MEVLRNTLDLFKYTSWGMVIGLLLTALGIGLLLRGLVRNRAMYAKTAIYITNGIAVLFGRIIGAILLSIALVFVWPTASNWINNEYLPWMTQHQSSFQQVLTRRISDPTVASIVGSRISTFHFGQMLLGIFFGIIVSALFKLLLQLHSHKRQHELLLRSLGRKVDPTSFLNRIRAWFGVSAGNTPPPPVAWNDKA